MNSPTQPTVLNQRQLSARQRSEFALIRSVAKLVLSILTRFWYQSGAAILAILLLYWLYGGWWAFLLLCFSTTGILYQAGDSLLYQPEMPANARMFVPIPSIYNMPYENITLCTKDGIELHAYLILQPPHLAPLAMSFVFLHGNAGNVGHRLANASGMYRNLQCNILLLEYRGYGKSQGVPCEEGFYKDAQAALDFLQARPDIDSTKIIIFGRSLGGAVAIDLASRKEYSKKIAGLIIENSFTGIPDIAEAIFSIGIMKYIPRFFYKNRFESAKKVAQLHVPTLFISGLADTLIPPRMMTELHTLCSSNLKRIIRFEGGTHNECFFCPGYYHAINMFLDDVIFAAQNVEDADTSSDVQIV